MKQTTCSILFPEAAFLDEKALEEIANELFESWVDKSLNIDFSEEQNGFVLYADGKTSLSLEQFEEKIFATAAYFEPQIIDWTETDANTGKKVSKNTTGVPANQTKPEQNIPKKEIKLWVDDLRDPVVFTGEDDWTWVKTAEEAFWVLNNRNVTKISLDHDLGEISPGVERKSGYDLVKWIEKKAMWPKKGARVHSDNSVGVKNMVSAIEHSGLYKKHGSRDFVGSL